MILKKLLGARNNALLLTIWKGRRSLEIETYVALLQEVLPELH
jgi:hypothetical protein